MCLLKPCKEIKTNTTQKCITDFLIAEGVTYVLQIESALNLNKKKTIGEEVCSTELRYAELTL